MKPQQRIATLGEALKGRQLAPFQGWLDYLHSFPGLLPGLSAGRPFGAFSEMLSLEIYSDDEDDVKMAATQSKELCCRHSIQPKIFRKRVSE
jgi:hypothetical protein